MSNPTAPQNVLTFVPAPNTRPRPKPRQRDDGSSEHLAGVGPKFRALRLRNPNLARMLLAGFESVLDGFLAHEAAKGGA